MNHYFNSTDQELLDTGEYCNYLNYAQAIWFDQRTGELMTRDQMIWRHLNYWQDCLLTINQYRAGKVFKWEKPRHEYKFKHRNSLEQTAKLLGLHLKTVISVNQLYKKCDTTGLCSLKVARNVYGKDWRRTLKRLNVQGLIKFNSSHLLVNPIYILTRDNWPTLSKRRWIKERYQDWS